MTFKFKFPNNTNKSGNQEGTMTIIDSLLVIKEKKKVG